MILMRISRICTIWLVLACLGIGAHSQVMAGEYTLMDITSGSSWHELFNSKSSHSDSISRQGLRLAMGQMIQSIRWPLYQEHARVEVQTTGALSVQMTGWDQQGKPIYDKTLPAGGKGAAVLFELPVDCAEAQLRLIATHRAVHISALRISLVSSRDSMLTDSGFAGKLGADHWLYANVDEKNLPAGSGRARLDDDHAVVGEAALRLDEPMLVCSMLVALGSANGAKGPRMRPLGVWKAWRSRARLVRRFA